MTRYFPRSGRKGLLRTHAWVIVIATVATFGSASAVALTRPTSYVATAQVAVGPELAGGTALRPEMASEREIATSGAVTARAADLLGVDPSEAVAGVSVSAVIESSILNIRYTATDAELASARATAFAQSYVDYRNSMGADSRMARVVTWPDVVGRSGENLPLILGVALLAGLLLGVFVAWLWDRLADRVRDPEEFVEHSGRPVLARIPRWSTEGSVAPDGHPGEAFAYVAARLSALTSHRRDGVNIVVTSPRSGAGTTTVAVNTAYALAAQGREVVLVGADLHRPRMDEVVGLSSAPGLLDVLDGDCSLESARRHTRRPNVSVLPLGGSPDAWRAGLQIDMLKVVLGQLGSHAIVVVDAPPVLESAASLLFAETAGVVLLVGDLRSGRRKDVDAAMGLMEAARPVIAGWVVNLPHRRTAPRSSGPSSELETNTGSWQQAIDRSDTVAS